jgi:putative phosphoribosyl transferase
LYKKYWQASAGPVGSTPGAPWSLPPTFLNNIAVFKNREEAAEKLALALPQYQHQNVLVLGIPNAGIEIAYYLAHELDGELSFLVTHELSYPDNPGTYFASITEDGTENVSTAARRHLSLEEIENLIEEAKHNMQRTIRTYRKENPFPQLYRRTVIITDDGSSPASALHAVIDACRRHLAEKVIVALPTGTDRLEQGLNEIADEVLILKKFELYSVAGEGYENFPRATEERALDFLKKWHEEHEPHLHQ